MTWLTRGHSPGRNEHAVSSALACHISLFINLSTYESFFEMTGDCKLWSPSLTISGDLLSGFSVSFELRNLSSVATQKYETASKMI